MRYARPKNVSGIACTLEVISDAWIVAEDSLRIVIDEHSPDANEEEITTLFQQELSKALKTASYNRKIERAYAKDLSVSFPRLSTEPDFESIAQGLIAEITFHDRSTEAKTGGDFGIVIEYPRFLYTRKGLEADGSRYGVLIQAKLKNVAGKWGRFTKRQQELLPNRLLYLVLLLYDYEDLSRRVLQRFKWQDCQSATFAQVENWLEDGNFPTLMNSDEVIKRLGSGTLGQIMRRL